MAQVRFLRDFVMRETPTIRSSVDDSLYQSSFGGEFVVTYNKATGQMEVSFADGGPVLHF